MEMINIHITDPPYRVEHNGKVENVHLRGTGSAYGRVLFTEGVLLLIAGTSVTIKNCMFTNHWEDLRSSWDRLKTWLYWWWHRSVK
jgi:hypothetical protein